MLCDKGYFRIVNYEGLIILLNLQQAATAKYIVKQYIAATGGQGALGAIDSMCAVGQVDMVSSPIQEGDDEDEDGPNICDSGGFVLWQMDPDFWYLELVVSSCKISAGSDGKISWSQSSNSSTTTRGPPRPLRRFYQVYTLVCILT